MKARPKHVIDPLREGVNAAREVSGLRDLRVGFAGTPEFAREALQALWAAGCQIPLVWTQPDRPAGRGLKRQASAVKQWAVAQGLSVGQPQSLRLEGRYPEEAAAAQAALRAAHLDVLVVAAYGLILPAWVLAIPTWGCLNIHASLLPRWRGAAPIHRAIEAGDTQTGITIMQMDEGLDTGDCLMDAVEVIRLDDTTASLHQRLAALGGRLIVRALSARLTGPVPARAQSPEGVCYAHKVDKAEAEIDWTQPADAIERRVRAFDPFPGMSVQLGGERIKVWQAAVVRAPQSAQAGRLLSMDTHGVLVACGRDALLLQTVQRPGGRRVHAREWVDRMRSHLGRV